MLELNSYGAWLLVPHIYNSDPAKLQSALETLAKHDSVVLSEMHWLTTAGWDGISSTTLRKLNPDIKVYGYYRCAKATFEGDWGKTEAEFAEIENMSYGCPIPYHEIEANDWWLRDGNGEQVVALNDKGAPTYYFLDLGKQAVQIRFAECLLERLEAEGYDGLVLDYYSATMFKDSWAFGGWFKKHPAPAAYPGEASWFNKAAKVFANRVFSAVRSNGYKVFLLCLDYSTSDRAEVFARSQVDGMIYEGFAMLCGGEYSGGTLTARKLADFENDPLECWVAEAGIRPNDPEHEKKARLSLAAYYLAVPVDKKRSYHYSGPGHTFWHPLWDFDIGTPAGKREQVGAYAWKRQFTNGLVIANADRTATIVDFRGRYEDINGNVYMKYVSLDAHEAVILRNLSLVGWLRKLIREWFG